jgi:hypothetical protein
MLKLQEKRRRMMEMQFVEGLKPRDIAKKLRVGVCLVYKTTELLKLRLKKILESSLGEQVIHVQERSRKRRRRDHPRARQGLEDYLKQNGIHGLTAKKVQAHILKFAPEVGLVDVHDIAYLLRHVYHLNYKRLDPAQFRYRDPYYDEKRLWASRLVTQLQLDGALIISIDESGFRGDAQLGHQW